MASHNNCTFSGNVGRDPELKTFQDGNMVADFTFAIEERDQETMWITVKVWGKRATVIADYVKKGSKLIVTGRLYNETWEKEGEKKSRPVLRCSEFTFIDTKSSLDGDRRTESRGTRTSQRSQRQQPRSSKPAPPPIDEEEEIPF